MNTHRNSFAVGFLASGILMLLVGIADGQDTSESDGRRLHLAPAKKRVRVIRKAGEWQYLRIPSPGNNYDELYYDVKVGTHAGKAYLDCTLSMTEERDDRITVPYVRLLNTNNVEFAIVVFSNATFWSRGGRISRSIRLPRLPRHYYIACGYAYYYDAMYAHMQGGPEETIVDAATGKIIHRGALRNARQLAVEIDNSSGLMFLGDTLRARVVATDTDALTDSVEQVDLDYAVYDSVTGRKVSAREDVKDVVLFPKQSGNYLLSMRVGRDPYVEWRDVRRLVVLPKLEYTHDPSYLGRLVPNDSVACGLKEDHHQLRDGRVDTTLGEETITDRLTGSRLTNIWQGVGRVVSYDRGFFGYTVGVNLKLNMPYLLEISYPEDAPRTFAFVVGNGTYTPGIHTAHTLGQPEPRYFAEQILFPLSKDVQKAQLMVWVGVEQVRKGFYVGVADPGFRNAPFSRKPLLLEITLREFQTIAVPHIRGKFPPAFQRYAWAESEDALPRDDVRFSPLVNALFYGLNAVSPAVLSWNGHGDVNNTILFRTAQYHQPVRRMIDGVEYETDQMEDASNRYNYWTEYLEWARQLKLHVFPCFEYGGSDEMPEDAAVVGDDGAPYPVYVRPSTGDRLPDSADVTHRATVEDATKLLSEGVCAVDGDLKQPLRQLVVRRRGNFLSTSYSDHAITMFEKETGTQLRGSSMAEKRRDIVARYHGKYRRWYQQKLMAFLTALQACYKRCLLFPVGPLLYYHWRQPGMPYEGVYFQTATEWEKKGKRIRCLPFEGLPLPKLGADELTNAVSQWTATEEGLFLEDIPTNAVLPVVPVYGETAGKCKTYLEQFRKGGELAAKIVPSVHSTTRLHIKTEHRPFYAGQTLYHSRQYSMYDPLVVFCAANPTYLVFEQAHPACFPYPEYARRFFANFLALPAVPLEDIPQTGKAAGLVVKMGKLGSTTYAAIANQNFLPVRDAKVFLPASGANTVKPLVGKQESVPFFVEEKGILFSVSLDAVELRSYMIE